MPARKRSKSPRRAARASAAATRVSKTGASARSRGTGAGAVVALEDLEDVLRPMVERLFLEAVEDWIDVREALKAKKEKGRSVSHEEVKRLLGL
jgi:hypothetical protein